MATWRLLHNNDLLRLLRLLARLLRVRRLLLILIEQVLELLVVLFWLLALRILGRATRGAQLRLTLMIIVVEMAGRPKAQARSCLSRQA